MRGQVFFLLAAASSLEIPSSTVRPAAASCARPPQLQSTASRRQFLLATGSAAILAASSPGAAQATYGPASGAVTSTPPLSDINIDSWLKLSPEKLAQRLGSISQDRAQALVNQLTESLDTLGASGLDALMEKLKQQREEAPESSELAAQLTSLEERIKDAQRLNALQKQLKARENLLARLDAQPAWVAYGCAAAASVGSTLIMHPVDTYKTLKQTAGNEPAEAASAGTDGGQLTPPVASEMPSLRELYRGLGANILKESPSSALYLGIYELVKENLMTYTNGPLAGLPLILVYLTAGMDPSAPAYEH